MKRNNHRASLIWDRDAFPVFLPLAPHLCIFPFPSFVSLKNPFVFFLCETLFEISCRKMAFPEVMFRFLRCFMYSRILLSFKLKKIVFPFFINGYVHGLIFLFCFLFLKVETLQVAL